MTGADLAALFDTFRESAFRVECRQDYDVSGEVESFRAFREGLPRPERSVRTNTYLQSVARAALAGKRWGRVRLVEHPLTEYTRYELLGFVESQAVGERVLILDRPHPYRGPDFWLFDAGTTSGQAVFMYYTAAGRVDGFARVTDAAAVHDLAVIAADLAAQGVPLNEFLAAERVGV